MDDVVRDLLETCDSIYHRKITELQIFYSDKIEDTRNDLQRRLNKAIKLYPEKKEQLIHSVERRYAKEHAVLRKECRRKIKELLPEHKQTKLNLLNHFSYE